MAQLVFGRERDVGVLSVTQMCGDAFALILDPVCITQVCDGSWTFPGDPVSQGLPATEAVVTGQGELELGKLERLGKDLRI